MKIYIWAFAVLVVVLIGQLVGMEGLYFKMPLFDIPMHILGGVGIALFVSAFAIGRDGRIKHKITFVVIGLLMAGLVWELFEIIYDIAGYPLWTGLYYSDTIQDIINDLIGGMIVVFTLNRLGKFK